MKKWISVAVLLLVSSMLSAQIKVKTCATSTGGGGGGGGTAVTDNFNRADGVLGSNWTTMPGELDLAIASNQVTRTASGRGAAYYSGATFASNQYSQMTITGIVDNSVYICARVQTSGSAKYCASINSSFSALYYFDSGGTPTQIGGTDFSSTANGDVIRMEVSGSAITVKRNGTALFGGAVTDANITGGNPGIMLSNSATADDFAGGDL